MNVDRERIRSNLEELSNACNTFELYGDAIDEVIELLDDCKKIVFCVDCKNRYTNLCPVYSTKGFTDDDWFCADAESW